MKLEGSKKNILRLSFISLFITRRTSNKFSNSIIFAKCSISTVAVLNVCVFFKYCYRTPSIINDFIFLFTLAYAVSYLWCNLNLVKKI